MNRQIQADRLRAFEERTRRRRDALAAWKEDHARQLVLLPPVVAAEVEGMAWQCVRADRDASLTMADIREATDRVVSRLRVKRYGPMPDTPAEWRRQVNETRVALGVDLTGAPVRQAAG